MHTFGALHWTCLLWDVLVQYVLCRLVQCCKAFWIWWLFIDAHFGIAHSHHWDYWLASVQSLVHWWYTRLPLDLPHCASRMTVPSRILIQDDQRDQPPAANWLAALWSTHYSQHTIQMAPNSPVCACHSLASHYPDQLLTSNQFIMYRSA